MACLPVEVVSKLELRIECVLVVAYLFDCLSSAIDDGHLGLSGCHQPQSWPLEVVEAFGRHRERAHWDASKAGL